MIFILFYLSGSRRQEIHLPQARSAPASRPPGLRLAPGLRIASDCTPDFAIRVRPPLGLAPAVGNLPFPGRKPVGPKVIIKLCEQRLDDPQLRQRLAKQPDHPGIRHRIAQRKLEDRILNRRASKNSTPVPSIRPFNSRC
jgi:hypothetical protein